MSKLTRVQPDLDFIKELQTIGGQDLKKCYQCATCSVVCPLSPMDNAFPRKEMIWAQWGLKDKLVGDIDMWLCHKCGQCTEQCPRGAKPGELMAALRNLAYRDLVEPKFLGKWMSSIKHLPKLIAIPAILYLIIWMITGSIHGTPFPLEHGQIEFGLIFPGDFTIDPIFGLVALFVIFSFYKGIQNLITSFNSKPKTFVVGYHPPQNILWSIVDVIKQEVLTHKKWKDCGQEESDNTKFKGHLLLFYGFVALFIVTAVVGLTHWGGKIFPIFGMEYPMPFWNPVKLLANAGAIALIIGLVFLTRRRLEDDGKDESSYYDWYLLGVIWSVALTGILSELLRWSGVAGLAYPMYYLHLISVFMLIAYLPWSKLGHLVYRIAALAYARRIGRISTETETQDNKIFVI
ncbi:MAG TPA: quinone-interacting membrane-bound oxidoreductase complex subunit QmoC [Desulfohalobiaceae bacterium]|nr:quinone-interacting membrane-bound oxidoreductase complex subunit QmoC [Desulfohalobiaceae bacterium]